MNKDINQKKIKTRRGEDGYNYPYTSPDLVIDKDGKSNTAKFNDIDTKFNDIKDKQIILEKQVNNLLLGSGGNGNNAEVVQARGDYATLNDRLENQEDKISTLDNLTKTTYRNINNSAIEAGNIADDGTVKTEAKYARTQFFIKVIGGKTIYLKKDAVGANVYDIFEYDAAYKFIKKTTNIYDYAQTKYTRTLKLQENTRYIKFKFWWTEAIDNIKVAVYYDGCGINTYEDYTQPVITVKSEVVDNTVGKPVICFNFDMTKLDNRYTALQNAGFTGTWQFGDNGLSDPETKGAIITLIKNGHDISPYTGLTDDEYKDIVNQAANITKLKTKVTKILEDMKSLGIYNPVMFSCARHRGGYVVKEAIKDLKFKYIRCSWAIDDKGKDYYLSPANTNPINIEQCPLPLNQYNTFEKAKARIDELLAQNPSLIIPMCHTMEYDQLTEENYFENLVNYIKTLSDNGKVKVMNMREYYESYFPEQGKKDDRVRSVLGTEATISELTDAKTDAKGVVHTNIGDALRATDKKINDLTLSTLSSKTSIPELSTNKLKNPLRILLNDNTFEVNFQDLKVYVKNQYSFYVTEYGYIDCRKSDGSKLDDIDIPSEAISQNVYSLYMLWFNPTTYTLNFTLANNVPANGVNFGLFYQGKPYLNNVGNGITVKDKNGELIVTRLDELKYTSVPHVTFYNGAVSITIDFDMDKNTITAKLMKNRWILFESGGIMVDEDKVCTYQANKALEMTFSYKLYINRYDGTPLIKAYNINLTTNEILNYAFVCIFSKDGLYSPGFKADCVSLNGKVPNVINGFYGNSTYDWDSNRFVLPNDLYLVKNIPYSISATDFNMQQLKDNDDCLFEITLPTKVVQFEQTAEIMIPYSYNHPFRTRLSGKYKYDNSILTQDINLHVADPSKATKKNIKVLCIGDSITQSNYPKHLKWHLAQMGITATMLGTVVDSHEGYSYGISQYLDAEKGEGRGGWRLTDFTCNTPLKSGGYYVNNDFPMMNPTTHKFDFSYYMQQQKFTDVDFVIINLGTNDIGKYHYAGSVSTNAAYNTIRGVELDSEYLNPESEYYLGKLYKTLIDSIHAFNSNIKIAINPPMGAGDSAFIVSSMKWAEVCHYEFKDTTNVYTLASYASQAQLSATNIESARKDMVQVNSKNNTYKFNYTPSDVHYNGMGQLIHTLYPASWIVNMCL